MTIKLNPKEVEYLITLLEQKLKHPKTLKELDSVIYESALAKLQVELYCKDEE